MSKNLIIQAMLPEGWTFDESYTNGVQVLWAPNRMGAISVDPDQRTWELGSTMRPRFAHQARADLQARYKGRGWLQILINDAVAALEAALK